MEGVIEMMVQQQNVQMEKNIGIKMENVIEMMVRRQNTMEKVVGVNYPALKGGAS